MNTFDFEIDTNFYPQDAVYSVAYLLLEKYNIKLRSDKKSRIIMHLTSDEKLSKTEVDELMRRIEQELINQTLRLRIAKENKKLREYILGKALLGAQFGTIDDSNQPDETTGDYIDDPLGIATPWEEQKKTASTKKRSKSIRKKKTK